MSKKYTKGQISIGVMVSLLTIAGVVFGIGKGYADLKGDSIQGLSNSQQALMKADDALNRVSKMEGQIDSIYQALDLRGWIPKK